MPGRRGFRCVTDGSNTNELKPGPGLGDESIDLVRTTADRMQFDVVCVRVGDNLIIINSYDMPVGAQTPTDQTAAAAYRAFIAK